MSLVTIATFSKPEEAHLLRMRLEAGEVPAFIQDENLVQMDWMFSNAVGGVRVQIDEEDADRAREILAEPPDETPPAKWPACPSCGSMATEEDQLPRRVSFLSVLLFNVPFLFARHRWQCRDCHAKWKA